MMAITTSSSISVKAGQWISGRVGSPWRSRVIVPCARQQGLSPSILFLHPGVRLSLRSGRRYRDRHGRDSEETGDPPASPPESAWFPERCLRILRRFTPPTRRPCIISRCRILETLPRPRTPFTTCFSRHSWKYGEFRGH